MDISLLLPASYRDDRDNLDDPDTSDASILRCIENELNLTRLSDLQDYL